jgi:hypothetical protein
MKKRLPRATAVFAIAYFPYGRISISPSITVSVPGRRGHGATMKPCSLMIPLDIAKAPCSRQGLRKMRGLVHDRVDQWYSEVLKIIVSDAGPRSDELFD